MMKKVLALLLASIMLILPLFSCVSEDISPAGSDEVSETVDTTDKESNTDETKESGKATESVNNGEQNNESNNNSGNADDNTGDDNTGDDNTGDDNTGDDNTGDDNTGDDNTGDDNTGDDNTGDDNTGDDNTGDDNTGDDNTDDDNTGDDNIGDDNIGGGGLEDFVPTEVYHNVTYVIDEKGTIEGEAIQSVKKGDSSKPVKAIAAKGYVFAGWSDGNKNETRSETNVKRDITVFPIFVNENSTYTVTYETRMNGKLMDHKDVEVRANEVTAYTAPNAPLAYTHGKWSNGKEGQTRSDNLFSDGMTYVLEIEPLSLDSVPSIEITINDGTSITDRVTYKDCSVTLSNADEEDCFENVSAQIRGRGNSSFGYPKKGFKIKFDKKRTMLGSEHKAKSWIFISNYGDKSLIRNMIAYDMSVAFSGLDYTVKHEFIDVYINNEYHGMYMMTDKIDVGKGRVDLDKNIYDDPSKMAYILEIGADNKETSGTSVKGVDYFSADRSYYINYPETDDPAYIPEVHLAYIEEYVNNCLTALSNQDWETICELIDIDSFIDYYIIQELYGNKDAFWRSVHFYKEPNGKLHAGPLWDLDQGAGNVTDEYGAGYYETTPSTDFEVTMDKYKKTAGKPWVACVNTWYRRLLRNEEFVELLRVRLKEVGPIIMDVLKDATTDGSKADSYYARYSHAMERNFERWKIMGEKIWPNTQYIANIKTVKGQIDYMREWLIERYDVLCDHYDVS